ncbi:MAG: hypothetical protein ACR2F9_01095 [Longimicrobiaceae bacterium]|jgi:hypothetical protein
MAATKEPLARKNFRLSQSKIDAAKKILGTKTETETVEMALDLVTFGEQLSAGIRSTCGVEWVDVFADDPTDQGVEDAA